jgi:pilus assembly protein Flp/PilA
MPTGHLRETRKTQLTISSIWEKIVFASIGFNYVATGRHYGRPRFRSALSRRRSTDGSEATRSKELIMKTLFNRFANDESGATAIEYGLIAALIAVAAISAMTTLGTKLTSTFTAVSNQLK